VPAKEALSHVGYGWTSQNEPTQHSGAMKRTESVEILNGFAIGSGAATSWEKANITAWYSCPEERLSPVSVSVLLPAVTGPENRRSPSTPVNGRRLTLSRKDRLAAVAVHVNLTCPQGVSNPVIRGIGSWFVASMAVSPLNV
jgi:hypothetical protein